MLLEKFGFFYTTALIVDDHNYERQTKKLDFAPDVSDFADEPKSDKDDKIVRYMAADFSSDDHNSEHKVKISFNFICCQFLVLQLHLNEFFSCAGRVYKEIRKSYI